jgi:valacyclovir hydrolase
LIALDGALLHYDVIGAGIPVLCCPGALGTGATDFAPQLTALSSTFRMVAPDPFGYGRSRPPERNFTPDCLERDAEAFVGLMTSLGHRQFYALGWSDGANTATLLAGKYPDRVLKLVIWGGNSCVTAEDIERIDRIRSIESWSVRMRESLERVYGSALPMLWQRYCDWIHSLYDAGGEICRASLPRITCPTLVLHGERDPLVPAVHPRIFVDEIRQSRLYSFPEGRHNLHFAAAERFNQIVTEFLSL